MIQFPQTLRDSFLLSPEEERASLVPASIPGAICGGQGVRGYSEILLLRAGDRAVSLKGSETGMGMFTRDLRTIRCRGSGPLARLLYYLSKSTGEIRVAETREPPSQVGAQQYSLKPLAEG